MSKLTLLDALRNNGKTGHLYTTDSVFMAHKTGFPVLDYHMGFNVHVYNANNELVEVYPSVGITSGSIVTIAGKTHVGKTTFAVQLASNIVRPFDNGAVLHCDIEGGTHMTRISVLSKYPMSDLNNKKYVLKQNGVSIDECKSLIYGVYSEKINDPEKYKYKTGKMNEFGEEIESFVPTCMIIDSVAALSSHINENTKDGVESMSHVSTQTETMRVTAEVGRFLKESLAMLKRANIILFLINHIKEKPPMGTPQQAEIRYLKQNETLPAGKACQYYSNTMLKLTSIGSEKYATETDGFNGFGVAAMFIKNRSSDDGTIVPMVFDKQRGYDSLRSSIIFAKSIDLLNGNRAGYYFGDRKDMKFKFSEAPEQFYENRDLYKVLYDTILPPLKANMVTIKPEEIRIADEEIDY